MTTSTELLEGIAHMLDMLSDSRASWVNGLALDALCQCLYQHLARGEKAPDWMRFPLAASYYNSRAIYHARGECL